ncbi:hypothetical protein Tco_0309815 [Tanacetum coccineum]
MATVERLDISIQMIGNSGDKILMLAVVDNVHGMHMHSLPMSGSWRGSHTWIVVAAMPYVCLSTLWKVEGWQRARIGRLSNLYRRTPWARFRHIHFGFMADHEAVVDAVNGTSMRQQVHQ